MNPQENVQKIPKLIIIASLFLFSLLSVHAKQIKILAIGNSFSDDAVEHYLHHIAAANGDTLVIGNLAIAGASLEMHYNNSINNAEAYSYRKIVDGKRTVKDKITLLQGLKDEDWDYISLQQASHYAGMYDTYAPYIWHLTDYVKSNALNPHFRFVLHMTWAYAEDATHPGFANYGKNQETMYNAIVATANRVTSETGIPVIIPAGTAIQNARTSSLGDTLTSDGFHLEQSYGRYTAACAWYEKLTGKCVVGNSYKPDTITDFQAFIAQLSAHLAVINPDSATDIITCD